MSIREVRANDPSLLILASLSSGAKHGYALMQDIETSFGVRLGPGSLYGAISRLERRGLIRPLEQAGRSRPYELTTSGEGELSDAVAHLETLVAVVGARLPRFSAATT